MFDFLFIYRAVKGVVTLGSLMSNLLAGKVQKSSLVTECLYKQFKTVCVNYLPTYSENGYAMNIELLL